MAHDWIDLNRAATTRLEALVARLTPADYAKTEDGWTVGAMLAHLAFWDRRGALVLKAVDAGQEPLRADDHFYDSDVLNQAGLPEWLVLPGPEAGRLAVEAARTIDEAIAGLSEKTVAAASALDELWRLRRFNHRLDHVEQISRLV